MWCGRFTDGRDVSRGDIIYLDSTVRSDTADQNIWSGGQFGEGTKCSVTPARGQINHPILRGRNSSG